MRIFRTFVLSLAAIMIVADATSWLNAQTAEARDRSSAIAVSIVAETNQTPIGETPWVNLTVRNLTDHEVWIQMGAGDYRVHVMGEKEEPPSTRLQRHLTGKLLPDERPMRGNAGFPQSISPGESIVNKYALKYFYDLSVPGKYSVYLEIRDKSGIWLRTNTVHFEMQAAAQ